MVGLKLIFHFLGGIYFSLWERIDDGFDGHGGGVDECAWQSTPFIFWKQENIYDDGFHCTLSNITNQDFAHIPE